MLDKSKINVLEKNGRYSAQSTDFTITRYCLKSTFQYQSQRQRKLLVEKPILYWRTAIICCHFIQRIFQNVIHGWKTKVLVQTGYDSVCSDDLFKCHAMTLKVTK